MISAPGTAQLQVRCRTWPTPASRADFLLSTGTSSSCRQPREFSLSGTQSPAGHVTQTGTNVNKLGQYYCFNRVYDIAIGRWTTPDPVATPWWNLADYVSNNPLQYLDSTGNDGGITAALLEALGAALKKLAVKTAKCIGAAIAAAATAVITVNVFLPGEDPCQIGCMAGIATFAACIFPGGSGLVIGVILDTLLGNPTEDFCKDLCKKIRTSGSTGPSAPAPSPSSTPRRVAHGISDGKTACASEEEMNGRSRPKPPADPSADPEGQRRYERERDEYDKEEKKKAEEEERLKKQREADRKPVKSGMA